MESTETHIFLITSQAEVSSFDRFDSIWMALVVVRAEVFCFRFRRASGNIMEGKRHAKRNLHASQQLILLQTNSFTHLHDAHDNATRCDEYDWLLAFETDWFDWNCKRKPIRLEWNCNCYCVQAHRTLSSASTDVFRYLVPFWCSSNATESMNARVTDSVSGYILK